MECNHTWKRDKDSPTDHYIQQRCPKCDSVLKAVPGKRRKWESEKYLVFVDRCKEYQVVRTFTVLKYSRWDKRPRYFISEVVQHWINEKGKMEVIACLRNMGFHRDKGWIHGSLGLRFSTYGYLYHGDVYPKKKVIPIAKRNGFTGSHHDIHPAYLVEQILTFPFMETLWKAKQYNLFASFRVEHYVAEYWPQIKLCIRHNHIIENVDDWVDNLYQLKYLGMDRRNPNYVCPENFNEFHSRLSKRYNRKKKEDRKKKDIERFLRDNENYLKAKAPFFGVAFEKGKLTVKVIENLEELMNEAQEHHHCGYSPQYYANNAYLLLTARYNGQRAETVHIDMENAKIVQSRGLQNEPTEHHNRIVKLVEENLNGIIGIYKSTKKKEEKAA